MTAKEFRKQFADNQGFAFSFSHQIEKMMIEFAQLKVEEALKVAAKKSEIKVFIKGNYKGAKYRELKDGEDYNPFETTQKYSIDKQSILNAYPLTNIK